MDKLKQLVAEAIGKKTFHLPEIGHDGQSIYLIWETHAQRFPYTEAGLYKALKLIPHFATTPGYVSGRSNIATKLLDSRKARVPKAALERRTVASATDKQRQSALDIAKSHPPKAKV